VADHQGDETADPLTHPGRTTALRKVVRKAIAVNVGAPCSKAWISAFHPWRSFMARAVLDTPMGPASRSPAGEQLANALIRP
jgi:hypothetical protein